MIRVGVIASTVLAAGVVALLAAPSVIAQPTEDPRATRHEGNVTTCAGAGLTGQELDLQQGTHFVTESNNQFVTIVAIPDGVEFTGTVIKGGNAYNVYAPEHREMLRAPLNNGGNVPAISHWFACGTTSTTTTTTTETTTTTSERNDTTTDTNSDTTSDGTSTTTTAGGGGEAGEVGNGDVGGGTGNGDAGDGDLAETGASVLGPLVAGAALLVLGTVLLFTVRRRRLHRG